mgnify:FL=1
MIQATRPAGRRGPTVISNEAVYQCYVDLCGANPPITATRQVVADTLGVPFRIIDEHTDRLLAANRLRRVLPGVFEPIERMENRAVSFTTIPGGGAKLEIGDQIIDILNMREGSMILGLIDGWLRSKVPYRGTKTAPARGK